MNNPFLVCTDRELRALPTQWLLAERWDKAGNILYDLKYMDAAVGRLGIDELLQGYATALRFLPKENIWHEKLATTSRVLDRQAHNLRDWGAERLPAFFLQQLRNEFFQLDLVELQARAELELAERHLPHLLLKAKDNRESPKLIRTLKAYRSVYSVALSADGRRAVSASGYASGQEKILQVWDVATGRELLTIEEDGHGYIPGVALSANGSLAVSSYGSTLKVWDVATGRELRTLNGHSNSVLGAALSADGQLAVSASFDKTLKVWDVATGCELITFQGHNEIVRNVALSADAQLAVSASDDHTLKVWDVVTGRELRTLNGHSDWVYGIALSADGGLAVSASLDHTLKVWNVATGLELRTLQGHSNYVCGVALSADGQLAVSASDDHTLKVWDVARGRELCTLTGHGASVKDVALSSDGQLAVSASEDSTLKVWDISASFPSRLTRRARNPNVVIRARRTLEGHSGKVNVVVLSTDGQIAISASDDHTLKVWDVARGRELRTLEGHSGEVVGVALSANGHLAVSVSMDREGTARWEKTLKVWNVATGTELRSTPQQGLDPVIDLALTPTGVWRSLCQRWIHGKRHSKYGKWRQVANCAHSNKGVIH